MLVDFIKKQATQAIIAKFIITGGLKIWLVKFLADYIFSEADEYIIEPLFRKIGFHGNVVKGKVIYEKVKDADSNDDWYDGVDNA